MAAQSSPRSKSPAVTDCCSTQSTYRNDTTNSNADVARRKSVVSGPEEMLLLREKLNEIAVGLEFRCQCNGDAIDDMDDESARQQRRERLGGGHFKVFPLLGDRPSTPPSSPQPRDVLRKQLRLRNSSSFRSDDNDRTLSSSPLDSVSVDAVEISRLDAASSPPTVRLLIPSHLRVRASSSSSSFSVKQPEGLRKRKSDHVGDARPDDSSPVAAPLKKVSSAKNMLTPTGSSSSSSSSAWDYDALAASVSNLTAHAADHEMADASSHPESPDCVAFAAANRLKRYT